MLTDRTPSYLFASSHINPDDFLFSINYFHKLLLSIIHFYGDHFIFAHEVLHFACSTLDVIPFSTFYRKWTSIRRQTV